MALSIKTPGGIWAKLIEQAAAAAKKPEGRGDAFVYLVGSRGAGKSTLLNRFLYPNRLETPKPSEGLEYTYARKPSNFDHEKKDLAHIWDVGGSPEFAQEIASGDHFLTVKQVTTAVVVIVVDLSDPGSVLTTLLHWLDQIKRKLAATFEKFEKKGLQLPEQLRQRAKSKLYSANEDKDIVYHSGISIIIAATKYDTFKDQDPEVKKVMARTLRWVAHSHGAFLMYLGGLHSLGNGAESKESGDERKLLDNFTKLMNHLIFTGLEKKPTMKMPPQFDHSGALIVPAGLDKFRDIGRPKGTVDGNVAAGLQEWKDLCDKFFPPKAITKAAKFEIDARFQEEEVDMVQQRKLTELEAYRKEQDAAKDAARKKVAALRTSSQAAPRFAGAAANGAAKGVNGASPPVKKKSSKPRPTS
mmetsp:Transcript_19135/g.32887  ORF Transcript_19135/g.32887 Transcript_19135/m.32887 type:complete len:414 (-) Transcript_19135:1059-2300(-)